MSVFEYIRSRSPETRAKYPLAIASVATLLIGAVWVTTLPAKFSSATHKDSVTTEKTLAEIIDTTKDQVANAVGSTIEAEPIDTSNLGSLDVHTVETVPVSDDSPISETKVAGTSSTAILPESTAQATSTDEVHVYTTPEPKIILIGTTTVSKSD